MNNDKTFFFTYRADNVDYGVFVESRHYSLDAAVKQAIKETINDHKEEIRYRNRWVVCSTTEKIKKDREVLKFDVVYLPYEIAEMAGLPAQA